MAPNRDLVSWYLLHVEEPATLHIINPASLAPPTYISLLQFTQGYNGYFKHLKRADLNVNHFWSCVKSSQMIEPNANSGKCISVMQVFHWGQPVGNHAFLESRDQCLQGRLGSVVVSRPVEESR